MKFKRQYILTFDIEADNAKGADYATKSLCNSFQECETMGAGEVGTFFAKVRSITPKSINPKRLVR